MADVLDDIKARILDAPTVIEADYSKDLPREWPILPPAALHGIAGEVVRLAIQDSEADPAAVL